MQRPPQSFYGGIPGVNQFPMPHAVNPAMVSTSDVQSQEGPNWRYGGMITYEKPITEFPGDIIIPVNAAGSITSLRAGVDLPNNCVGVRFISLVTGVQASINGQGQRTILNGDVFSGCEINSMVIITDATGSCIIQAVGTGD